MDDADDPYRRRPGTFGAGFLVPDADAPDGWTVHTYEHSIVWDPEPRLVRRRIAIRALELGLEPCSSYDEQIHERGFPVPDGLKIAFCFEVGPGEVAEPHVRNHPEWHEPDAILVIALLERLGMTVQVPELDD